MPILVVDGFQVITVQYNDSERNRFFVVKSLLKVLNIIVEAALVSYGCECVNENALTQIIHLMMAFFDFLSCQDNFLLCNNYSQQSDNDNNHRNVNHWVFPYKVNQCGFRFFSGIIRQCGVDRTASPDGRTSPNGSASPEGKIDKTSPVGR